jgi:hypothetical protein
MLSTGSNINMEKRNCQNCKNEFEIEPEDFLFYKKIQVPPPTFCPHCRFVRRMIWRNERSLYKRQCDLCGNIGISMYDDKISSLVYCPECYKSDKWLASEYFLEYDFSKTFFHQFIELFKKVPRQSLGQTRECINSVYANFIADVKNVYMAFSVIEGSEDVCHASNIDNSKQIVDSYNVNDSEIIYEGMGIVKNYNSQYSYWSSNCIDCNFILDCNNCQDCFNCVNLQNKRYCVWNKQYNRVEYEEKIKEFKIGSNKFVKNNFKEFWDFTLNYPRKYARMINCNNSSGDELRNCNNTKKSFNCFNNENIKYGYRCPFSKDSMDVGHCYAELAYEHAFLGSENSQDIKFVINGGIALNKVEYTDYCRSSSNLFGCIGLKNKQYCILNKQYTKEEYEQLIPKIKQHMNDMPYVDKKGRVYKYGEFFPTELSPFGYNETVISEHFPLAKEEILEKGYNYKEKTDNKYTITLKVSDIPDNIKDVTDSILDEVIECEVSGRAFKITPFELQFYRRMNIPIPRLHPDERYKKRLALRNPMKLWHRKCMNKGCENEFETTYSPDRPEIVYCDSCYKKEVY